MIYVKTETGVNTICKDYGEVILYDDSGSVCGLMRVFQDNTFETLSRNKLVGTFQFSPIGSTGLHYAAFQKLKIVGPYYRVAALYSVQIQVTNSGVIWASCPVLHVDRQGVNGVVVQYGNDTTRTTTFYIHAFGLLA